ncbi:MAG: LPS-assembly protein LptD, partial [Planctomycetota bacterium]
ILRAERLRRTSENSFTLENASYSTCEFEDPHYRFDCTEIVVTDHEDHTTFTAYNNIPRIGEIPIGYLPILGGRDDFDARPLLSAAIGSSSRFGTETELLWGDDLVFNNEKWGQWRANSDHRSDRGHGLGAEIEYKTDDYEGTLGGYYQRDRKNEDDYNESPIDRHDRGQLKWEHRHRLGDGWRLDLTTWDFSDRDYQPEFRREDFLNERDPETYADLTWTGGTDQFRLSADMRTDAFRTDTEKLPSMSLSRIGAPMSTGSTLAGLLDDLTYSAEVSAGAFEREFDEDLGITSSRVLRQDATLRLEGVKGLGPFRLTPFALGGTTQHQGSGLPGEEDLSRGDLSVGVKASIEGRKDWADVDNETFDLDGLRHVVTVEASWIHRMTVSEPNTAYVPVDDLDDLQKLQAVSVRMRNRLQTKRGGLRVDWVDLEARGLWFPERLDPNAFAHGAREEGIAGSRYIDLPGERKYRAMPMRGAFGPYEADLRIRARENLFLLGEAEYDP